MQELEKKRKEIDIEIKTKKINIKYDQLLKAAKEKYEREVLSITDARDREILAVKSAPPIQPSRSPLPEETTDHGVPTLLEDHDPDSDDLLKV